MRCVAAGAWESDMGFWQTDAAWLIRERRRLEVDDIALLVNVTPEFASPIGARTPGQIARSVVVSSVPDAILISGPMAGAEPDLSLLEEVYRTVSSQAPVFLNTGAKAESIAAVPRERGDGCIVGSDLKEGGYTWNRVDPQRAERFVRAARGG